MGLSRWWRHAEQPRPTQPVHRDIDPPVADVVHQLQDISSQLREQVARLEDANDRVEQSLRGRP